MPDGEEHGAARSPRRPATTAAVREGQLESLMVAAQAGDAAAYDTLLRQVLPLLRSIARRRIVNPQEAEDAVQDALLCIHQLRHTYDPDRPLRPWLVALCERRCVDRLRRRLRRAVREAPIDELSDSLTEPRAADRPVWHVAARELRAAVEALPRSQRVAIALAKLQELSLEEASARSGLTARALKMATHRAMRTLRLRLHAAAEA